MEVHDSAVALLRELYSEAKQEAGWLSRREAERDQVISRYQEVFSPTKLKVLRAEDFRSFLTYDNNKHWTGIQRRPEVTKDLSKLKDALSALLDEGRPISERFREARSVKGFGHGQITPILSLLGYRGLFPGPRDTKAMNA